MMFLDGLAVWTQKSPEARHVADRGILSPARIDSMDQVAAYVLRPNRCLFHEPCGDGRGARKPSGTSIAAGELAIVSRGLISL
jgi:hypothetical protein